VTINPTAINSVTTPLGNSWPTLYEFMATNGAGPEVNISCDGGQSWSHVNIAPKMPDDSNTPGGLAITNDFVIGGLDPTGRIYTAWAQQASNSSGQWQIFYSYSTDTSGTSGIGNCTIPVQGGAWHLNSAGHPSGIALTGSGTQISNVNFGVMPAIAVGDPGRVDIAYYGDTTDPSSVNPAAATSMTWSLHMAQTTDALDATPVWNDVVASETPMHAHSICFSGLACELANPQGDRNLADFFEVKPDPTTGRAVILFVDDNNTQPGPPGTEPGAPLISSVQQASGPSLFANVGSVPSIGGLLSQSLDLRDALIDPAGDAALPAHQPAPGSNVDAADITNLSAVPNGNQLQVSFKVKNLGGSLSNAVVNNAATAAAHQLNTGAIYLASWHFNNDLWGAWVSVDAAGNATYLAGKPLDVFSSSEPKTLQWVQDPQGASNHVVTGSVSGDTITMNVPLNTIGDPTASSVLYGFTGFTADTQTSSEVAGLTGGSAPGATSGNAGFFNNIDQTAPMDVPLSGVSTNVPESPWAPLLVSAGLVAAAGGAAALRRRRRHTAS
jgi:hypothetical protein